MAESGINSPNSTDHPVLGASFENSTPTPSGRSQRVRKKPKRWTDDQVEVDYSVVPSFLYGNDNNKTIHQEAKSETPKPPSQSKKRQKTKTNDSKVLVIKQEEQEIEKNSESSSDEDDNNADDSDDSDFSIDENPEELWCICRKPYGKRFMIGCDLCEEWFHGQCVGVTRAQGRKFEKLKQEWLCPSCQEGLEKNIPREDLKQIAQDKVKALKEEEARVSVSKKSDKKKSPQKSEKEKKNTSKQEIKDELDDSDSGLDKHSKSQKAGKSLKVIKENSHKDFKGSEEMRRLKKLIKASKKDLNEKQKMFRLKEEHHTSPNIDQNDSSSVDQSLSASNNVTSEMSPTQKSKAEPPTTPKKKHKDSIDQSALDLFKAEPVLIRSLSTSSATQVPGGQNKASGTSDMRRASVSSANSTSSQTNVGEIACPAGCGKVNRPDSSSNLESLHYSIYCNNNCIQTYVADTLKYLRSVKKQKEKSDSSEQQRPLKVVLQNRINNKVLTGKDAILEKDVLTFILKNPMYEIHKLDSLSDSKLPRSSTNTPKTSHTVSSKETPSIKSSNELKRSHSNASSNSTSSSSAAKLQRSASISENPEQKRDFVRKQFKEVFHSRYKELSSSDQSRISTDIFEKLARKIEEEMNKLFKTNNHKYTAKFRSLIFNLKDQKNSLYRKVMLGKVTPERLVNMSPEELAPTELARWRENEKKASLDMIKRDAVEQANQVIVKKTHKGEEFITENDIIAELPSTDNSTKIDSTNTVENVNEPQTKAAPVTVVTPKSEMITPLDLFSDTTSQHKLHEYSQNCKICTRSSSENSKSTDKISSSPQTISTPTTNDSTDVSNHRSQPKRIRVEPESSNKFLQQAVKLSEKATISDSSKINSPAIASSITNVKNLPNDKLSESKSSEAKSSDSEGAKNAWKGTIYMQDVAKFVASAHVISGSIANNLAQDINDQITVCGRITPEQVSDYISKLRSSKRTEICIVQFKWVSREERTGYDAFFNYLHARGRYGVVGNSGKTYKDFYILPLPHNHDIPKILHPIDGPGVPKRQQRPNLLLGILIHSRKHSPTQPANIPLLKSISQSTPPNATTPSRPERSYTPPLSTFDTPPQKDSDSNCYTPPRNTSSKRFAEDIQLHDSNHKVAKYDPEEIKINATTKASSTYMNDLMEQVASSSNPVEMTSSVLSALATSDNYELQKRLIYQLTEKVEDQRRNLEKQKKTENKSQNSSFQSPTGSNSLNSVFKNIEINSLKDILNTVQKKSVLPEYQPEIMSESLHSKVDLPEQSPTNNYTSNPLNDPRLLMPKNPVVTTEILPSPPSQPVANMSQAELLRMAHEQMEALKQMSQISPSHQPHSKDQDLRGALYGVSPNAAIPHVGFHDQISPSISSPLATESQSSAPKISFQWKKKK